jgi:hypothetical protein
MFLPPPRESDIVASIGTRSVESGTDMRNLR